jgi:hypothetical protein
MFRHVCHYRVTAGIPTISKEILRWTDQQAREAFPDAGGVDCNMYMSQEVMPHKLVFRAGWNPGDLRMLVEGTRGVPESSRRHNRTGTGHSRHLPRAGRIRV